MAILNRIQIHPIKALDPVEINRTTVQNGGLEYDRKYAMFDDSDEFINGKKTDQVHQLRSSFDPELEEVTLWQQGGNERHTFDMCMDREALERWLCEFFEEPVTVVESTDTRFTDTAGGSAPMDISAPGPSVVSGATYEEISSWFTDLNVPELRGRFRTNLEIAGVPPFWEDKLFADEKNVVEFYIGDVLLRGVLPLPRCVVPTRNPFTGERDEDFVSVFTEKRAEKFPQWADAEHLGQKLPDHSQHYFYLTVVTRIPSSEDGKVLEVGDEVEIIGEKPLLKSL